MDGHGWAAAGVLLLLVQPSVAHRAAVGGFVTKITKALL
jgi:hypothetical protein